MMLCCAQVAWAAFAGMEGDSILCMLQQATLTAYSLKGALQTVPLPPSITAMHPLPHGLLLSVRPCPPRTAASCHVSSVHVKLTWMALSSSQGSRTAGIMLASHHHLAGRLSLLCVGGSLDDQQGGGSTTKSYVNE